MSLHDRVLAEATGEHLNFDLSSAIHDSLEKSFKGIRKAIKKAGGEVKSGSGFHLKAPSGGPGMELFVEAWFDPSVDKSAASKIFKSIFGRSFSGVTEGDRIGAGLRDKVAWYATVRYKPINEYFSMGGSR